MKAKTINEIYHFERGIDPKDSMNIGGIDPKKIYNKIMEEPLKKWLSFVKSFEGKTIKGHFLKKDAKWEELDATFEVDKAYSVGGNIGFTSTDSETYENKGKIRIVK